MATNPKAAKKTTAKKTSAKRSPKAKGTTKPAATMKAGCKRSSKVRGDQDRHGEEDSAENRCPVDESQEDDRQAHAEKVAGSPVAAALAQRLRSMCCARPQRERPDASWIRGRRVRPKLCADMTSAAVRGNIAVTGRSVALTQGQPTVRFTPRRGIQQWSATEVQFEG